MSLKYNRLKSRIRGMKTGAKLKLELIGFFNFRLKHHIKGFIKACDVALYGWDGDDEI